MKTTVFKDGVQIAVEDDGLPDPPTVRTPLEIIASLTDDEYTGIWTAAQQSPQLSRWLDMMRAAQEVRSDDPRTIAGCAAAVQFGLLTAERVAEVFGVTVEI